MKKTLLIFASLFFINSFAQQAKFIFTKERSEQLKNVYYRPTVYRVTQTQILVSKFDTIKTITKKFAEKQIENEKQINDSLLAVETFKNESLAYKTLNSILNNLKLYLNSNSKFKDKKLFLINAQNSADSIRNSNVLYAMISDKMIKPAVKNVIYADDKVNPNFKKDFKELNSNEKVFTEHISLIVQRIESLPKPKFYWKRENKYLGSNYALNNDKIKKYDLKFEPKETVNIEGFTVEQEIDYLTLIGTFIKIDTILSKTETNNLLVLKSKLKGYNVELNKFRETTDILLQNIESKEYFLGTDDLVNNFAINNELIEMCEKLNKNGFSTKQIDQDICIILGNQKIKLDDTVKEKIKKNDFAFITNLSKSIDKYKSLANQSKPIFDKLSNHINSYRSGTLTKERLMIWKQDNLKGQEILKQFNLLFKSQSDIYYLDAGIVGTENSITYQNIVNAVLLSNKFIGM